MREIGAIAAYLISWLFCELVLGIQSGLLTLIISLLFAIGMPSSLSQSTRRGTRTHR